MLCTANQESKFLMKNHTISVIYLKIFLKKKTYSLKVNIALIFKIHPIVILIIAWFCILLWICWIFIQLQTAQKKEKQKWR